MTDGAGLPLAFTLTPGQRHEVPVFEQTVKTVRLPGPRGRPHTRPRHLAGDKAYSYRPIYAYLRRHGCSRACDSDLYRRRNVIERCVGWLKGCRALATRHEKLALNFAATVKLAFLRHYLRAVRPSDTT